MPTHLAFDMEPRTLDIAELVPGRTLEQRRLSGRKYARILASIREVGIIEMPLVYQHPDRHYEIVDGHLRIEALKTLGVAKVRCLVSDSPERFGPRVHVPKLSAIQEHYMITKAIEHGVSAERLARALEVDVKQVLAKHHLLRGICLEAVQLLEKTSVSAETMRGLRKVLPARQVEIAELMIAANNFTATFCRGLVLATRKEWLAAPHVTKKAGPSPKEYAELVKMQYELDTLQRDLQVYEDTYGQNFLNLVVARGYLAKLLANERAKRLLCERYPEIATAMQHIVDSVSLEG